MSGLFGIAVLEKDGTITAGCAVREDTPEEWAKAKDFLLDFPKEKRGRYGHTLLAGDAYGRTYRRLIAPHPDATFTVVYPLADALAEGWTERS